MSPGPCRLCSGPTDRIGTLQSWDVICRRCRFAVRFFATGRRTTETPMTWSKGEWRRLEGALAVGREE